MERNDSRARAKSKSREDEGGVGRKTITRSFFLLNTKNDPLVLRTLNILLVSVSAREVFRPQLVPKAFVPLMGERIACHSKLW
jgi:hypothetical protein